jgi:hypothetical protein
MSNLNLDQPHLTGTGTSLNSCREEDRDLCIPHRKFLTSGLEGLDIFNLTSEEYILE